MRAVQMTATGGPDVLVPADLPDPRPGPGELLVDVAVAGVNYIDTYHRRGVYPVDLPLVPGLEGGGAGGGARRRRHGRVRRRRPGGLGEHPRRLRRTASSVPGRGGRRDPGRDLRRRRPSARTAGHDRPLPRPPTAPPSAPATPSSCTRRRAASGCCSRSSPRRAAPACWAPSPRTEKERARPGPRAPPRCSATRATTWPSRCATSPAASGWPWRSTASAATPSTPAWTPAPPRHARALRGGQRAGAAGRPAAAQRGRLALPHPPDAVPLHRDPRGAARPRARQCLRGGRRREPATSGSGTATRSSEARAAHEDLAGPPDDGQDLLVPARSGDLAAATCRPSPVRKAAPVTDARCAHAVPRPRRLHRAPRARARVPTAAGWSPRSPRPTPTARATAPRCGRSTPRVPGPPGR